MATIKKSININAPVEKVFEYAKNRKSCRKSGPAW